MSERIAIIGMACRFPGGANSPQAFWRVLCEKHDPIVEVPRERWDARRFYDDSPDTPGKAYVRSAGFLTESPWRFDPLFFGLSPREAEALDPQQRLVLTASWEALEDAGIPGGRIAGSCTGVFIGGFGLDAYGARMDTRSLAAADSHTGVSCTMTMLASRVSHALDLRGPAIALDTACSSSLVAAHFACRSLAAGDCDLALVGGVNVMLTPSLMVTMCKGHFLSKHARCMTFDERADGFVRAEGVGVVVLKPFERAQADGDRIYAVIRGSAVNQDGRTPGIVLPAARAQADLMRRVYAEAAVKGGQLDYVEAHGTGTQAGDAAEVSSLDEVLREHRVHGRPCIVGSLKSNIGHLEAAAGVASLIKTALVLHHGAVPPNLHFEKPNPKLELDRRCLRVPTSVEVLEGNGRLLLAGVNSFGYGGTNAHVLMEQYRAPKANRLDTEAEVVRPHVFPISARCSEALAQLAERYSDHIVATDPALADFGHTLVHRRTQHHHRLAVIARTRNELVEHLAAIGRGEASEFAVRGAATEARPPVAFMYSGMGPQWWGMGQQLYRTEPVFRQAIDECEEVFQKVAGWSVRTEMLAEERQSKMSSTVVAQRAVFTVQVALTRLLESWGIRPEAVCGHSLGEVAAAWACSAVSLEDAVRINIHRSRLASKAAGTGGMLAIGLPEDEAAALIAPYGGRVSIAAVNAPEAVTLAGDVETLAKLETLLAENEIFARILRVEVAYHSHDMDPIEGALREALRAVTPRPGRVPFYSTVLGALVSGEELNADYWWRNIRYPVRFTSAVEALARDGFGMMLEVGPHPVLSSSVREINRVLPQPLAVVHTLRRERAEQEAMAATLAGIWCAGGRLDWSHVCPTEGKYSPLPTYPWQTFEGWAEAPAHRWFRGTGSRSWLQEKVDGTDYTWRIELTSGLFPWLKDHRVSGQVVFPGAGYVETALMLAREIAPETPALSNLRFHRMLTLTPGEQRQLCVCYQPSTHAFEIWSETDRGERIVHCDGRLAFGALPPADRRDLPAASEGLTEEDTTDLYARLENAGLTYGSCFQTVAKLRTASGKSVAELRVSPEAIDLQTEHTLHPALLDGAFQAMYPSVEDGGDQVAYVPASIARVVAFGSPGDFAWADIDVTKRSREQLEASIRIYSQGGELRAVLEGLVCSAVRLNAQVETSLDSILFEPRWSEIFTDDSAEEATPENRKFWLIGEPPSMEGLEKALKAKGAAVVVIRPGESLAEISVLHGPCTVVFGEGLEAMDEVSRIPAICSRLADVIRHVGEEGISAHVCVLSKGAVRTGIEAVDFIPNLAGSPLFAVARVGREEYANVNVTLTDLDPSSERWERAAWSLQPGLAGQEIAVRRDRLFQLRLETFDRKQPTGVKRASLKSCNAELVQTVAGSLQSLTYRETDRRAPVKGEFEVRIHETSIGFKDLLKFTGQIAHKALEGTYFGDNVGMLATGTVVRVGPGRKDVHQGDRVVLLDRKGTFRAFATVDTPYVVKLPDRLSLDEPGLIPALTAHRGLVDLAGVRCGQTVLIHNAAGGVGLFAVQVAKEIGARIFATASTEEKRQYLLECGAEAVYDSHTTDWGPALRQATDGAGVAVAFGAVFGDQLRESLESLAVGGRYVDIGKRDIAENKHLPMSLFQKNMSYSALDLDVLLANQPEEVIRLLTAVVDRFARGVYKPLQANVYPASDVISAFRAMADRKRIGPVCVRFANETVDVLDEARIRADGTYLITGGLGGFGLTLARHLAEKKAGGLVLVSRKGVATDEARAAVKEFEAHEVRIMAAAVDVSERRQVGKLLAQIRREMPPLRGIFHAAMVLDDRPVTDLDEAAFTTVFAPKLIGALNLHELTKRDPLDVFVMFSSMATLIGNRSQANYAAANGALDALAQLRRASGLPAASVSWGVLGGSGVVARNEKLRRLLETSGMRPLSDSMAIAVIDEVMRMRPVHVCAIDADWATWGEAHPKAASLSLFSRLRAVPDAAQDRLLNTVRYVAPAPAEQRAAKLLELLLAPVGRVLGVAPEKIDASKGLADLGLDSLMAVELAVAIERDLGLKVPSALLLDGQPLKRLGARLTSEMGSYLSKNREKLLVLVKEASEGTAGRLQEWMEQVA
jgi:acyl transferase domain-containing protein/NAD(P)-dependent dehydrogenase (short-subunit alcohol dehydrogenase family)/acyl carrier protein